MATCPKCGAHIAFYDWRPNCHNCGVNIMYYGIDESLEADSKKAEIEYAKFDNLILGLKRSVFGSVLILARLIAGFLVLGLLCLPIVTLSINLPFVHVENVSYSIIQTITGVMDLMDWMGFDGIISLMGSELAIPTILLFLSVLMLLLSALISFVATIIYILPHPEKGFKRNVVLRGIVIGTFIVSVVLFFIAQALGNGAGMNIISGGISYGGFIYLAAQLALLYIEFHIKKHGIPDEPLKFGKKKKEDEEETDEKEKAEEAEAVNA